LVGSSAAKKVPGLVWVSPGKVFFSVFLNFPHREPRNARDMGKKIEKKSVLGFWGDFFVKTFQHDSFAKRSF
jgi:hypothetical protein